MKKQKAAPAAPDIEQYLNFGTEHDNKHALDVWLSAIKTGVFVDAAIPLKMFVELQSAFLKVFDQPAKVIPIFEQQTNGMNDTEKQFMARQLLYYFEHTVFAYGENKESEIQLTGISKPLDALLSRLSRETGQNKVELKTGDLRQILKDIFRQEMERLPEYLQSLETKDRLNVLCKMLPFVLPKVESVRFEEREQFSFL